MSIFASKWAYTQKVGQPGAKAILVALADHADEAGYCFPSQQRLANMTEIAPRSVRRHLAYLEDVVKLIRRQERRTSDGKYISDGYHILAPAAVLNPYDSTNETRDIDEISKARRRHSRRPVADPNPEDNPADPEESCAPDPEPQKGDTVAPFPDNLKPSGQIGHRSDWPAAKLARTSGQIGQNQRPNWPEPAAKLANGQIGHQTINRI